MAHVIMHKDDHYPTPYRAMMLMGVASMFTLVNLFSPQAAVPALAHSFDVSPWLMGVAINAAAIGMAIAGLVGALVADRFDRKFLIVATLALLAVPTAAIFIATSLAQFVALRFVQGLLMAANFAVSIAYVAEEWGPQGTAPVVMSAYVTGNIAGQIFGRVWLGVAVQAFGWRPAFLIMAALTATGAVLLWRLLPEPTSSPGGRARAGLAGLRVHLRDSQLLAAFAVGFLILLNFVGVFTYINFYLITAFKLSAAQVGTLYLVFSVALLSTPAAGMLVKQIGHRRALICGAAASVIGTILTLSAALGVVLCGLGLVGAGLFFCQAVATGFVGQIAATFRAAGSGLYLSAYYCGGIVGAALVGGVLERWGWPGCVGVLSATLVAMGGIAARCWQPIRGTDTSNPMPAPDLGDAILVPTSGDHA